MRSVGLLLTMFSLASLLALTACGGEAAPETAPTTTVGAGPSASGSTGTSPRVIVAEPAERRTVVVEAPTPPSPPSVTVTVPSPPSVTVTH